MKESSGTSNIFSIHIQNLSGYSRLKVSGVSDKIIGCSREFLLSRLILVIHLAIALSWLWILSCLEESRFKNLVFDNFLELETTHSYEFYLRSHALLVVASLCGTLNSLTSETSLNRQEETSWGQNSAIPHTGSV